MQKMLLHVTRRNPFCGVTPDKRDRSWTDPDEVVMNNFTEASASIREINLSYITLAQRLLQEDRPVGMRHLGLSDEIADILTGLSQPQVVKLAAADHLLCSFRFNDHAMLAALTKTASATDIVAANASQLTAGHARAQFA
jgi:flagellar transcriptional activator FlhD